MSYRSVKNDRTILKESRIFVFVHVHNEANLAFSAKQHNYTFKKRISSARQLLKESVTEINFKLLLLVDIQESNIFPRLVRFQWAIKKLNQVQVKALGNYNLNKQTAFLLSIYDPFHFALSGQVLKRRTNQQEAKSITAGRF